MKTRLKRDVQQRNRRRRQRFRQDAVTTRSKGAWWRVIRMRIALLLVLSQFLVPVHSLAMDLDVVDEKKRDRNPNEESAYPTMLNQVPVSEPIDPDKYICGVGDQFLISLWGQKEAELVVSITPEGDLVIPSIGKVNGLSGQTLREVKGRIRWKIGTVYTNISYDVQLARPRTFLVHLAGHARTPGEYQAMAITRVSQLVRNAGGPSRVGSLRFAEVWRNDELVATVDFFRLYRYGEIEQDVCLIEGDVVKIPLKGRVVSVYGSVEIPGEYELAEGEQLQALIYKLAAGYTRDVSRRDPIEVVRRKDSDQFGVQRFGQDAVSKKDLTLIDQDRVYVPSLNRYQKVIRVQGAVVGTGALSVESKTATKQLLGDKTGTARRGSDGEVLPGSGQGGQVREFVGVYPFIEGETVSKVLDRVGGVQPWADTTNAFIRRPIAGKKKDFETIPVDLTAILIEKNYSNDVVMLAGDFLIVPSMEDRVFVTGEVIQPGPQSYAPYYRARYYVGLAGGQTARASLWRSKIIKANGEEKKLDMDSVVGPGDTIYLKEKSFKFWQDHWTILTGAAAIVLSGFAVLYAYDNNK